LKRKGDEVANIEAVKATAEKLYNQNDETALEVLIAKCDAAVKKIRNWAMIPI
jgi:hypothetical protein